MTVKINANDIGGELSILPSKSFAHRQLICAALSDNPCEIICNAASKDIEATVRCLRALGAEIEETDGIYKITPIKKAESGELFCGESGSTLRFLIPVASALGEEVTFTGEGRLPERPCLPLVQTLRENGAEVEYDGRLPLTVRGGLTPGRFRIAGNISSQFITGLILALPLLPGDSEIEITGKCESLPYINITLDCVKQFGIAAEMSENLIHIHHGRYHAPEKLIVEGDWSNAAFWTCLGAITKNGITVTGLNTESIQGDCKIITILKRFGADIVWGNGGVTTKKKTLRGCAVDASEIPDLVPVLSVVAAVSEGKTRIYNASRLRLKESDRIESTAAMLRALGAEVTETEDGLEIIGKKKLLGGSVDSYNDHRIAMSAAIASAVCDNEVEIRGAEAVNKSYGNFFEIYETLGAEFKRMKV